ncbi:hypothetical protein KI387_010654, partial [Taxus chinensis]
MAVAMATTSTPVVSLPALHLHKHSCPKSYFQFRPLNSIVTSKLSVGFLNANHNAKSKCFSKVPKLIGFELGISSGLTPVRTHVTVCFATAAAGGEGDNNTVNGNEGEVGKEGGESGKGGQTLNLISEADLLKKKAKKLRRRRRRLVQKRKLRKKGKWPPSKMAKLK